MICQLDDKTLVGGQITPAEVAGLKAKGVTMIVNNRLDGEDPGQPSSADIEKAAQAAGIDYRHVPISHGIGPSVVEEIEQAMEQCDGLLLAYCRSGTRSTLAWAVARRRHGASLSELSQAASRAGIDLSPVAHLL